MVLALKSRAGLSKCDPTMCFVPDAVLVNTCNWIFKSLMHTCAPMSADGSCDRAVPGPPNKDHSALSQSLTSRSAVLEVVWGLCGKLWGTPYYSRLSVKYKEVHDILSVLADT